MTKSRLLPLICGLLPLLLPSVSGRAFTISSPVTQCKNATLQFEGDDPVRLTNLIIVPVGSLPPQAPETRKITWKAISSNTNEFTFPVTYPGNTSFVLTTVDTQGFANITLEVAVKKSDDSSCLNTVPTVPDFTFSIDPMEISFGSPVTFTINTTPKVPQPPITFVALTPGGRSIQINQLLKLNANNTENKFSWTSNLDIGTKVTIAAADKIGNLGGSTDLLTVQDRSASNTVTATAPSSTSVAAATGVSDKGGGKGGSGSLGSSSSSGSGSSGSSSSSGSGKGGSSGTGGSGSAGRSGGTNTGANGSTALGCSMSLSILGGVAIALAIHLS